MATRLQPWEATVQPTTYEAGGLRAMVAYGFLILALCLMIADFYRLMRAPAAKPFAATSDSHYSTGL